MTTILIFMTLVTSPLYRPLYRYVTQNDNFTARDYGMLIKTKMLCFQHLGPGKVQRR